MKTKQKGKSSLCSQELPSRKEANTRTSTKSATFRYGAVCMVFLLLGFQLSLFIHHTGVLRIEALRDHPDTVYIVRTVSDSPDSKLDFVPDRTDFNKIDTIQKPADHSQVVKRVRSHRRRVENFCFDPNTVSIEDLCRLGFSEKQAHSIVNYRNKGGRFSRAQDFAKSYVVSDSVFARLEPYIRIPKIDINTADSASFDALPGIGPYYASQMVKYRSQLGGYSCTEQLMELYHFDNEKYRKISDLVECRNPHYIDIWNMQEDSLACHPAIRRRSVAHSIKLYIENSKAEDLTIDSLFKSGIIDSLQRVKLNRCVKKAVH